MPNISQRASRSFRSLLITALLLAFVCIVAAYAFSRPLVDFAVYWTAGHLFGTGHDVYSLPAVFAFQKSIGLPGHVPLMFLSPPWSLPLFAGLGYANYVIGWLVWVVALTAAAAFGSKLLMDLYFGALNIPEISEPPSYRYLFAFTFYPVLLSLKMAQLGAILLLGVAGFAYFQHRKRPISAGLCLAVLLLKPHLFVLFYFVLLLRREWKVLAAAAATIFVLSAIAVWREPDIFRSYWMLMSGPYPKLALAGILAGMRSEFQAYDTYWLQFLPPIVALVWFSFYWRSHRQNWSWTDRLPVLTTASIIGAPYGYIHDQALLIIPVISIAASVARQHGTLSVRIVALYTLLNATVLIVAMISTPWCVVPAPLAVAVMLYRESRKPGGTLSALAQAAP